ncbi:Piso0_002077 [Millerozyma farinosa CBS 7064]|uniref:Piso0_002077 protein n=1 Tax=Pichia sorbitophila (strain ATCC MYA-4447 / BCRC 22081 / CBS 7064 / NBRC 10061 / NRRL Y-12695) TaxID=559304 RepID=G8YE22_PICSO|nr:Piso0_002077 [Millerozyma farinosa CBS 7064]
MGNDGGTIAKRKDYLSLYSHINKSNDKSLGDATETDAALTSCSLSSLPLYGDPQPPLVGDYRGHIFLKEKILEFILERKQKKGDTAQHKSPFEHIKSINDLVDLTIKWRYDDNTHEAFPECPATQISKKSATYAYLRPCGCVLSYDFLMSMKNGSHVSRRNGKDNSKRLVGNGADGSDTTAPEPKNEPEVAEGQSSSRSQSDEEYCPSCSKPFSFDIDMVVLNTKRDPELDKLNESSYLYLTRQHALHHSKKPIKMKKRKKSPPKTDGREDKANSHKKKKTEDLHLREHSIHI